MKCPNGCGEMDYDYGGAGHECPECGEFVGDEERPNPKTGGLIGELRALAEKWESSGMVEDEACAMELREVLEDYNDE